MDPKTPTVDLTVAIRAYNSAPCLPEILRRLRLQQDTELLSWEVVIVDNNSTDDTPVIVGKFQKTWLETVPLRYCTEKKQGAVFARLRAVQEAQGVLIAFLDDDNLPGDRWVAAAFEFGQAYPQAGAYGSRIIGKFETAPPPGFERIQSFLAIKERGSQPNQYRPEVLSLPAGAGLVVRKQVWLDNVPKVQWLQGPINQSLSAKGEDFEALMHIAQAGWEIWYSPTMLIEHWIPGWRLERQYLIELIRHTGLNVYYLRTINVVGGWKKSAIALKLFLGSLRRIVIHLLSYRLAAFTDTVAICELNFFWSTLVSPFHLLKQKL
ncbi:MAG: glycosyltransferase family 2 protein [Leptolyngbyaceae cyanobacterium SM1_1_3]|nr:glycosyltransferase family 2 protein [Leptolyngbyaceae cyanobacterium SM1_1_3]NJN01729.1 glycosyltransferase family 2 protein [Leptolyngbyaceae cyanobacterium RM1_1_2]NJO09390.1 glycosyltransferase family 2 protein [Leptolyngbyaceae cyanobacterium SL_1_1]